MTSQQAKEWVTDSYTLLLLPRTPARRIYNPLREQPGLFRRFADLGESNQEYLEFVNLFGVPVELTASVVPPWNPDKLQHLSSADADALDLEEGFYLDWDRDVAAMRAVLALHDTIERGDLDTADSLVMAAKLMNTFRLSHDEDFPLLVTPKGPLTVAKDTLSNAITNWLGRTVNDKPIVFPLMAFGELQLFPRNLLGAMWLQLAVAVWQGKRFRRCPARNCRVVWFEVSKPSAGPLGVRADAEFCSRRCRNTAYRDRRTLLRKREGRVDRTVEGTSYVGRYRCDGDIITVTLVGGGTKATQLGGSADIPGTLAGLLFRELIDEHRSVAQRKGAAGRKRKAQEE